MKKVKIISKYLLNGLTIVNALLVGINEVEGINIPYCNQISGVVLVVCSVISAYLLGGKGIDKVRG